MTATIAELQSNCHCPFCGHYMTEHDGYCKHKYWDEYCDFEYLCPCNLSYGMVLNCFNISVETLYPFEKFTREIVREKK